MNKKTILAFLVLILVGVSYFSVQGDLITGALRKKKPSSSAHKKTVKKPAAAEQPPVEASIPAAPNAAEPQALSAPQPPAINSAGSDSSSDQAFLLTQRQQAEEHYIEEKNTNNEMISLLRDILGTARSIEQKGLSAPVSYPEPVREPEAAVQPAPAPVAPPAAPAAAAAEAAVPPAIAPSVRSLVALVDGDMEAVDVTAWRPSGEIRIAEKTNDPANVHSGNQSIHVASPEDNQKWAAIHQELIPVEAGKSYRLSFQYKLAGQVIFATPCYGSPCNDVEGISIVFRPQGSGWSIGIREFKVPDNFISNDFNIIFTIYGDAYIDDIVLEEINAVSLLMDGDMEAPGTANWEVLGNIALAEKTSNPASVFSGKQSIHIVSKDDKAAILRQRGIRVKPGQSYRLFFQYKFTSNGFNVDFLQKEFPGAQFASRLCLGGKCPVFEDIHKPFSDTGGNWVSASQEFRIPDELQNADFSNLIFMFVFKGDAYFDDIKLEAI